MAGRASAQQRTYRMAYLTGGALKGHEPYRKALFGRLEELGYREGQNLVVERRFAEGRLDRLAALAAELVALKPDIFVAAGTEATLKAREATRTIPIVFISVRDPVCMGIVKSLRRPGTNATGVSTQSEELQPKLLQLLKEVFPSASRVAVLHNPLNTSERALILPALKEAGATLALKLRIIETRAPEDLPAAFKAVKAQRADVLYVISSPITFAERGRIAELANGQRQAAVYSQAEFAEAGGLMSFAFSLIEQYRAGAEFVDRVLKGANPAGLPVERPTRSELVLNLVTARTQGVSFPAAVLARADRVIE
jgi:putative tryptophan/tyrosine transport system substrate-binding protein